MSSPNSPLSLHQMEDWIMKSLNWTEDMYSFISNENEEANENETPCNDAFPSIGGHYKRVHGYVALCVCLFGALANTINLLILTRKEMRSPINLILSALALVDVLVMIEYIPFALLVYILYPAHSQSTPDKHFSYGWALLVFFHSHFTQILHTMSIQLTLTMAIWRYAVLKFTNRLQLAAFCTFRRCYLAIAASFICPLILCIPNYLTFTIRYHHTWTFEFRPSAPADLLIPPYFLHNEARERDTLVNFCKILSPRDLDLISCMEAIRENQNYVVDLSPLAEAHGGVLHVIHFWTFSVIVKLLPCVVLTFFIVYLLHVSQRHIFFTQFPLHSFFPVSLSADTKLNGSFPGLG